MSERNVDILRGAFQALAQGDLDSVIEVIDLEAEYRPGILPLLGADAIRGRDEIRRFLAQDLVDGFDQFSAEPLSFEDLGESVLVETRYTGRGETSGLEMTQAFFALYTFREELIIAMEDYETRHEALEAAGRAA